MLTCIFWGGNFRPWVKIVEIPWQTYLYSCFKSPVQIIIQLQCCLWIHIHLLHIAHRVRRVGFFNFGSGRVRVLKKYFGSGRVGYRVFVSNTKSIGYYGVLKSWSGIRRVSPLFPILSNIYYLIWLIWSIKHVFGRHIYVIVVQCGRSWQPFGDRRKSHKPLESAHLQNFATKMPYL